MRRVLLQIRVQHVPQALPDPLPVRRFDRRQISVGVQPHLCHVAEEIGQPFRWWTGAGREHRPELEKVLAGSKSSGATEAGTSARVLGSLLSWMQEKTAPVFVVATANDVSQLSPELLRAGRWDCMFFVDLPNVDERQTIRTIQIRKHGRNPVDFDPVRLARTSEGLTGSEIETVFVESLYDPFDRDTEPTDLDIARVLTDFVPLSKTMAEQIDALRKWSRGRARLATSQPAESRLRKLAA